MNEDVCWVWVEVDLDQVSLSLENTAVSAEG
jgi:hypothetical protein